MKADDELKLDDGRVATLLRNQTWITNAAKRHIAGDLMVVVDKSTGSQIDAVIYEEGGKRRVGILKHVVVWTDTKNPALNATSYNAFEIPDVSPDQSKKLIGIYERFKK